MFVKRQLRAAIAILLSTGLSFGVLTSLGELPAQAAPIKGCESSGYQPKDCRDALGASISLTITGSSVDTTSGTIIDATTMTNLATQVAVTCTTGTISFSLFPKNNYATSAKVSVVAGLTFSETTGRLGGTAVGPYPVTEFDVLGYCSGQTSEESKIWKGTISVTVSAPAGAYLNPADSTMSGEEAKSVTSSIITAMQFGCSDASILFSISSGTLPTGLSLSSSTGPSTTVTGSVSSSLSTTVTVLGACGSTQATSRLVINISEAAPVETTTSSPAENVKVTLCHRTHAENNPYVRITVSVNAVNRPSGHQGHDEIFGDAHVYTAGIYKRAKDKKWGDIIPPDPTGQNRWRALNWTTLGQEIFNGTVPGCKSQTPQEYYNALRESGVPEKDIKRELAQLEEDEEKTEKTNLKDLGYTGKNELVLEQEKDKVTICHRTAAVTNPYRKITVAASSIYKRAGHLDHNESYNGNTVFNPSITYPANQKRWGDIIPPDPTGLNRWRALNWNAAGQAIYNGSVAGCSEQTYQEYYNALREDGIPKKDVKKDIERQDNVDDDPVDVDDVQYTGDDPEVEKTEPREPTPPENKPVIDQSLSGIVWLDRNRDGLKDADEPLMPNIVLTVVQVSATAPASNKSIGMYSVSAASTLQPAATTTVLTDKDGFYVFPSLGAGDWRVVAGVPDQLNVTYDSQGSADGAVQTTVPPGSSAFTWVGLVGANGTTNQELVRLIESGKFTPQMLITAGLAKPGALAPGSSSSTELAATGSNELRWLVLGLALMLLGAVGLRRSRRLEN